ncbi:hypothetical protein [Candidatus Phytoplasma fraxini]|uniref:S26 family signal peptidase n=1 Tax=Ash yellows phytoplasma TaxID=35780 RepID=A0ABZ2U8Y0_ASHYP
MIYKKILKFYNFIIFSLYYVLLFLIIYFILLNVLHVFYPRWMSKFIFFNISRISSKSMKPKLNKNDLIITRKITDEERELLKPGDWIVFYVDEHFQTNPVLKQNPFILHEVQINNPTEHFITTKGINNRSILDLEKNIDYKNILFKIVYHIPLSKIFIKDKYTGYLGYLFIFLSIIYLFIMEDYWILRFIKLQYFNIINKIWGK